MENDFSPNTSSVSKEIPRVIDDFCGNRDPIQRLTNEIFVDRLGMDRLCRLSART
jgi:hypothetical protein